MSDMPKKPATGEADQWTLGMQQQMMLVSILLQNLIGNEKCHLPDVQFGTVFIDLVTFFLEANAKLYFMLQLKVAK